MSFAGKWMELEISMLSERSQIELGPCSKRTLRHNRDLHIKGNIQQSEALTNSMEKMLTNYSQHQLII